jgi:hypothetical protein
VQARKLRPSPPPEFVEWTEAHFQTEETRDRFLLLVAETLPPADVEVVPMVGEARGAMVRWRPGSFNGLNDIAYAHGGRIVFS